MTAGSAAGGVERTVTIVNRLGLHARAASRLVMLAAKFQSEVGVARDGRAVSGKSIMGVLMLAAGMGSSITLSARGADAEAAVEALARLVENRFGEEA
jgi:phosphocarrier protein